MTDRPSTVDLLHMLQLATERYLSVAADPDAEIDALLSSEIEVCSTASALAGLAGSKPLSVDEPDIMIERRDARFAVFYARISREIKVDEQSARIIYATAWDACRREIFTRVARSVSRRRAASFSTEGAR